MFDINALLPAFDPASIPSAEKLQLRLVQVGYRTHERGKPVYRLDGYYSRDLPVTLTDHRHQFKKIGKRLYRAETASAHKPTDKLSAEAIVSFRTKLKKPGVTYGDLGRKSAEPKYVPATDAEVVKYEAAVLALKIYCRKLLLDQAQVRHKRSQTRLIDALKVVRKAGFDVAKPPVPVQA
jgi:hypothetical protein